MYVEAPPLAISQSLFYVSDGVITAGLRGGRLECENIFCSEAKKWMLRSSTDVSVHDSQKKEHNASSHKKPANGCCVCETMVYLDLQSPKGADMTEGFSKYEVCGKLLGARNFVHKSRGYPGRVYLVSWSTLHIATISFVRSKKNNKIQGCVMCLSMVLMLGGSSL